MEQDQEELQEINEDTVTAKAVAYGLLGVVIGSIAGAAIMIGIFFLVQMLIQNLSN